MGGTRKSTFYYKTVSFVFGLILASVCLMFELNKMDVLRLVMGEGISYDRNTLLFNSYELIFTWTPWVILALLLILKKKTPLNLSPLYYFYGSILPISVLLFTLFFGPSINNFYYSEKFDSVAWLNPEENDFMWPARLRMVDDLISSGKLDNLSRRETIKILGEPSMTEKDSNGKYTLTYHLGPERGFIRIDSEWLSIEFNKNDEAEKYWTWSD